LLGQLQRLFVAFRDNVRLINPVSVRRVEN
jgi:hypothetical protein